MSRARGLGELRSIRTATLTVGYHDVGDPASPPVILLHGFPYDPLSYVDVAGELASAGRRVIVPYLRGHGPTTFLDPAAPRSGQQAALGTDVLELMDALELPEAVLAGYDWGGRAACVVAAAWPERVRGLVSVNGYLIQDIAAASHPLTPRLEAGFWYFFYFLTERGRAGLAADPRGVAEVIWRRNSPNWSFTDDELDRVARSFENPDYVDVVIHSYRHRMGFADGAEQFAELERFLATQPVIPVPTITLDGTADGNFPATDGTAAAAHFSGPREHRQVDGAGHNLPRERPHEFVRAVFDVTELQRVDSQDARRERWCHVLS
ncbi:alpha/beta hydrolase [Leifsonia sp. NPDC080035]|uniref:Alpha/beta hydrolase n=1 Tax=Leifsonia sp. NPDC080035 TaxID=3143936 RepID=A0AAU7GFB7_9MICO